MGEINNLGGSRARSSARMEHRPPKSGVVGSNPNGPAIILEKELLFGLFVCVLSLCTVCVLLDSIRLL